jgi:hypothetical protein
MRSDKAKSLDKVAGALIKNPLGSVRETAELAGVSKSTAADMSKELGQTRTAKDPRILSVTDTDMEILTLGQREIVRRMKTPEELEKMRTVEISSVTKESAARYTIFRGSATDNEGGLKDTQAIKGMSPSELADYIKQAISQ